MESSSSDGCLPIRCQPSAVRSSMAGNHSRLSAGSWSRICQLPLRPGYSETGRPSGPRRNPPSIPDASGAPILKSVTVSSRPFRASSRSDSATRFGGRATNGTVSCGEAKPGPVILARTNPPSVSAIASTSHVHGRARIAHNTSRYRRAMRGMAIISRCGDGRLFRSAAPGRSPRG